MLYVLLGIVVTSVAVLMVNHQSGELFGYPIEAVGSIALLSTLLLFLLSQRGGGRRSAPLQSLKYFLVWAGIGFVIVLGYSFKDTGRMLFERVAGELVPGAAVVTNSGEVFFRRAADGHFQVRADIDGTTVPMLLDSGASAVVLTRSDAEAIGIDTSNLAYLSPVNTANGQAFTAPITLSRISVGGIEARNVSAMVAQEGALRESLLGMTYLNRLGSWSVAGDRLTLTP
nr:TIGR02281 family clan AA aspartic protease [uncultured Cohaesibacter sp.]